MSETSVRRSMGWGMALSWGQRIIGTLATLVLAAILGPEVFGIVAMALVFIAFIDLALEQGVATAIIQREQLDPEHLDAAFWINLVWCLLLAGLAIGLSGWWADLMNTPELAEVIPALSITIVVLGLTIVPQALVVRELKFRPLAIRANVAALAGGATGIALALSGAGVWSLVAQQVVSASVALVLLWSMSRWRPHLRFSRPHARQILGFSSNVFVANVGGFINRRSDTLLMGAFFGPSVVGVYRLADRFVDNVLDATMRPVGVVSLPHLAKLQRDRAALQRKVEAFIRYAMLTALPGLFILAACAEQVLAVIGDEWVVGTRALELLCVVGAVKGLTFITGPVLFTLSRPLLRAGTLWLMALVSVVVVIVAGRQLEASPPEDQLTGMAGAWAVVSLLLILPLNLFVIGKVSGFRVRSFFAWLPAPVGAGIAAIVSVQALAATGVLDQMGRIGALAVAGGTAVAVTATILFAVEPVARYEIRGLLRGVRPSAADDTDTLSP